MSNINTPVVIQTEQESSSLDIRRIIGLVLRYWYILVLLPLFGLAAGIIYTRYLIPVYRITGTIMIRKDDKQKSSRGGGNIDPSNLFSTNVSNVADEIEILKSRALMTEVLKELNINPSYVGKGRIRNSDYYTTAPIKVDSFSLDSLASGFSLEVNVLDNQNFELVQETKKNPHRFGEPFTIGSSLFKISFVGGSETGLFGIQFTPWDKLASSYLAAMKISPIKGEGGVSNGISITYEDAIPERGVDILNKLVEVYNRSGVEDKGRADRNAISFIDDRIVLLTRELGDVEKNIESYKKREGITVDPGSDVSFLYAKL